MRVVVTGIGLLTPAGTDLEQSWRAVCQGVSTAAPDPELDGAPVTISCRVPAFDPEAAVGRGAGRRLDRYTHLAVLAARQAYAAAGLDGACDPTRTGVVLGCGIGGVSTWEQEHTRFLERGPGRVSPLFIPRMLANMAAGVIAMDLGITGPNLSVNTACASGASALQVARDLIRAGAADVVLAGGAEAGITPMSVSAFAQMGALSRNPDPTTASRPFDRHRDGFVMGEGAGVLVLEEEAHARARGAPILAVLAGAGSSADAHHPTAPPEDGAGAALALTRALADAGIEPADVDHINAHGTSTPLNDRAEARAIRTVLGTHADGVAVTSTKGSIGHLLGAAGAVEAAFAVMAVRDGVVPPTAGLEDLDPDIDLDVVHGTARRRAVRVAVSDSFGFGGQNCVLVFTAA